jgi:hypothetical protein
MRCHAGRAMDGVARNDSTGDPCLISGSFASADRKSGSRPYSWNSWVHATVHGSAPTGPKKGLFPCYHSPELCARRLTYAVCATHSFAGQSAHHHYLV